MYVRSLNREGFVNWVSTATSEAGREATPQELNGLIERGGIALLWQNQTAARGDLPPVVCIRSGEVDDFFAFTSTYLPGVTPFSAFYRVLPADRLDALSQRSGRRNPVAGRALMGATLAEAFAQVRSKASSLRDLTVSGVLATLSASLAAGIHHAYPVKYLEYIVHAWTNARTSAEVEKLAIPASIISGVWQILWDAFLPEPPNRAKSGDAKLIASILRDASNRGDFTLESLQPAFAVLPQLESIFERMKASREERVRAFGDGIKLINQLRPDSVILDFMAGALLSMVGSGSFEFLPLTERFADNQSGAVLWFGVCAALHRSSDIYTAGSCLGRRIARDTFAPYDYYAPPHDDICFDELEVIRRGRSDHPSYRTLSLAIASIEILPGVSMKTRGSPARGDGMSVEAAASHQVARKQRGGEELKELRYLFDRARVALERLVSDSDQADLYDRDERGRRRK